MLENNPLVSVIIRTYNNRNSLLKEAVESVLSQTYDNLEIVIVEDGSEYAKKILNLVKSRTTCNIVYETMPKSGRCIIGNKGMQVANGEYLIFLDDDDKFYESHIEDLITALQKNNVLVAYSNAYEVETEFLSTEPLKYVERKKSVIYNQEFSRALLWRQNYMSIQSVLFSKKLFLECGGFDSELDALEDWHLWVKFSLKTDFYHLDKVTSMYRVPYKKNVSNDRLLSMEQYKQKVFDKQKELLVTLTVKEFNSMVDELDKKTKVISVSKDDVRNFILKYSCLNFIYWKARAIYYSFLK